MVRDPLLRSTPRGTHICTFSLASNRFFKQDSGLEKEVSFFEIESWSKLADQCYSLGRRGRGVRVVGRLKQDRWNSADGKPHSKVSIIAEHVEFRPEFKKDDQDGRSAVFAEAPEAGHTEGAAPFPHSVPFDAALDEAGKAPAPAEKFEPVF
jgi:single-strand DNA-binding protein